MPLTYTRATLLSCLLFVFAFSSILAQTKKWKEKDYADTIQTLIGGEREYAVQSGRVDLLTDEHAFEVEWANKWKDAIGQSLWYGLQTNRKPGIVLILRSKKDYKYYIQLNSALSYAKLQDEIAVYIYPEDFEDKMGKH
ncbi:hypothetical protein [Echinicola rosea]|uniref:TPM domain-containing protein n=1 Tax=Echinicola rosea TaxID=1807691 RepID=A0ABQ1UXA3_9BACT|nr:hypothetical protein [Echinicola rosea]GGF27359.1 hypothetical protein GCM10011339_14340 [Echinicola rosea]